MTPQDIIIQQADQYAGIGKDAPIGSAQREIFETKKQSFLDGYNAAPKQETVLSEQDKFYAAINPNNAGCTNFIVFLILLGIMLKACGN